MSTNTGTSNMTPRGWRSNAGSVDQLRKQVSSGPKRTLMTIDKPTLAALLDVAEAAQALWVPDPTKKGIGFGPLADALKTLYGVIGSANPQELSE